MMTGAQALIESLKREGVCELFGYAGATICPAVDALAATDIHYTLVRTEQNAGHMASGYARVSGKVGVCMVTSGPGATNLITGIATAYMDSIPIVAITGQVQSHLLGRDIFQEVDITGAVAPFIKHSYLIKDVRQIPRIVKEAFHIASTGRKGPVLLDIPIDVQQARFEPEFPEEVNIRGYKPSVKGNAVQVKRAVEAIAAAQKPVIVAGGGVVGAAAQEELRQLAETTGIPVVTTMMGLSILPTDHPLYMGMIGSFGNTTANKVLAKSDLCILCGARVADRAILQPSEIGRRMKIIHLDVDPAEIGKNMSASIPIVGDVKVILQQILELSPTAHPQEVATIRAKRELELRRPLEAPAGTVHPGAVLRALGARLDEDATVCVDVGQNQIWACTHLPLKRGRFLTTGGLGTMGYSLPAALGAKIAEPGKQTVVICGDGSFQMFLNELSTLRTLNADVKIVLIRNQVLGLVHQIQESSYPQGPFGVDLEHSPDFGVLADAYGIPHGELADPAAIDRAVEAMLAQPGPYLLICDVDPNLTTSA